MPKVIYISLFFVFTLLVIFFIDAGIRSHNLNFYSGKDGGYIIRIESIVALNTLFYILMTTGPQKKLINYFINTILGFCMAIILSIAGYLILAVFDEFGLTFHIVTVLACYASYFGIQLLKEKMKT